MNARLWELCRRLIAARSVTTEGTREIAHFVARDLLAPAGIKARLVESTREGAEQVNLIAHTIGAQPNLAPLVLNTHLDTVPPGDFALWTRCDGDPFAAALDGDRIYGLGAADTKLDLAAKIMALADARPARRDVWLVGTFGEEHGLAGAKEIADAGILPRGGLAFVGEPSNLSVITAHKGLMAYAIEFACEPVSAPPVAKTERYVFHGRAAHSSTPALGLNAILAALNALAERPALHVAAIEGGTAVNVVPARCEIAVGGGPIAIPQAEPAGVAPEPCSTLIRPAVIDAANRFVIALEAFALQAGPAEPDYAPPTLTCNPGIIRSSEGSLTLEFETRPPPSLAPGSVRAGIARVVDAIRTSTPGVRITLTERRANPGFRSPAASETVELAMAALAEAKLPLATGVKAGCTEAGIYAAAGMIPVVFGPGPSTGVIHAPNEYNLLSEVESAVRFYRSLLTL